MGVNDLAIGEKRYFDLSPVSEEPNATLDGYSAKYEMVSPLCVEKVGNVEKSDDNTKFLVRVDTNGLFPSLYELRVLVTDLSDDFVKCVYSEKINLRK